MEGADKLQAIGQILLLIREKDKRLQELKGRVSALRQAMNGKERKTGPASKQ